MLQCLWLCNAHISFMPNKITWEENVCPKNEFLKTDI